MSVEFEHLRSLVDELRATVAAQGRELATLRGELEAARRDARRAEASPANDARQGGLTNTLVSGVTAASPLPARLGLAPPRRDLAGADVAGDVAGANRVLALGRRAGTAAGFSVSAAQGLNAGDFNGTAQRALEAVPGIGAIIAQLRSLVEPIVERILRAKLAEVEARADLALARIRAEFARASSPQARAAEARERDRAAELLRARGYAHYQDYPGFGDAR